LTAFSFRILGTYHRHVCTPNKDAMSDSKRKHSLVNISVFQDKQKACSIFDMMYTENSKSFPVLWGQQNLLKKTQIINMFFLQCAKYNRIFWEYASLCFGLIFLLFRKITLQRQKTVSPIKWHGFYRSAALGTVRIQNAGSNSLCFDLVLASQK